MRKTSKTIKKTIISTITFGICFNGLLFRGYSRLRQTSLAVGVPKKLWIAVDCV